jgi:acyl-CoA synthetase (AMP-forming)/AMP-acid ligase II
MSRDQIGKRSIVDALSYRARVEPDKVPVEHPLSGDLKEWKSLSFSAIKAAVDKLSWWIDALLVGEIHKERTICYIAGSDVRYFFMYFAAVQAGCKVINFGTVAEFIN